MPWRMDLPLCRRFLVVLSRWDPFWMFRFLKAVVFSVRICIMNVGLESENLRFCSVRFYINATNVLLAEKSLGLMRFVLLKNT